MEKKKSKLANQEKNKSIYVIIGLSLSMAFALEWLEWENSKVHQDIIKSSMLCSLIDEEPVIEFKPKSIAIPPKPKPVVSEPVVVEIDPNVIIEKPIEKQIIVPTINIKNDFSTDPTDEEPLIIENLTYDYAQTMPSFPGGVM